MRYQSGKRHSNHGLGDITQPQPLSTMAQAALRRRPIGIPILRRIWFRGSPFDKKVHERQNAALAISRPHIPAREWWN